MQNKAERVTLKQCLKDIPSYLEESEGKRQEFITEIYSITNVEEVFNELLAQNEEWNELAKVVRPQYLFERTDSIENKEIQLLIFDGGVQPVIKVSC